MENQENKKEGKCEVKVNVDRLFYEADVEVQNETITHYREVIKEKLNEKKAAQLLLSNIERELENLKLQIHQELN